MRVLAGYRTSSRAPAVLGFTVVATVALVFPGGTASASGADAAEALAVVAVEIPPALRRDRAAIETEIERGLVSAGWVVSGLAETTRRLGDRRDLTGCTNEVCLLQIAQLTKALYVLNAKITTGYRQHQIDLRIFDASDGSEVAHETVGCQASDPACPPVANNAYKTARFVGRAALQAVRARAEEANVALAANAAPGAAPDRTPTDGMEAPGPAAPGERPGTVPPDRGPSTSTGSTMAWTAVGVGAALLVTAGVLAVRNGAPVDCHLAMSGETRCHAIVNNHTRTWVLGVAGAATAGLGLTLLILDRREARVAITLSPRGVEAWGRF
jgi:hypothetical protein